MGLEFPTIEVDMHVAARSLLILMTLLLEEQLLATSFVPPRNLAELASGSDAVVFAEASASRTTKRGGFIFTETEFIVLRSLSGELPRNGTLRVHTPGGTFGDHTWLVAGTPSFKRGRRYLLSLDRRPNDRWLPKVLAYGILIEDEDSDGPVLRALSQHIGRALPRPDGVTPEAITSYRRDRLLDHLEAVLRRGETWSAAKVRSSVSVRRGARPLPCTVNTFNDRGTRWSVFDEGRSVFMQTSEMGDPSMPDAHLIFEEAVAMWSAVDGTSLNLEVAEPIGMDESCEGISPHLVQGILRFDDPCDDIADLNDCFGTYGIAGPFILGSHNFDGQSWATITNWAAIVNNGAGCLERATYRGTLAGLVGFALGFGISSDPSSIVSQNCCSEVLSESDEDCLRFVYPARPIKTLLPGDCNQDGNVNISDAICVLNHLFLGRGSFPCGTDEDKLRAVDHTGDGVINLTDGIALLNYLALGGPPHALGTECVEAESCEPICE